MSIIEPYSSIQVLSYDDHGWLHPTNARNLQNLIETYDPEVIVELGAWLGATTCHLAKVSSSSAVVYAVDHFLGGPDIAHIPEVAQRLPNLYQQFLSNVRHMSLCHKIVPVRMEVMEAARALNIEPNLVYMDACMFESSFYPEAVAWWERLASGGILCGDDWICFPEVPRVLIRLSDELGLTVHHDENFWWCDPKPEAQNV